MNTPLLKHEHKQTLLWTGAGLALLLLLYLLSPILAPFVFAGILAYVLQPGVHWLTKRRVPRSLASLLMVALLLLTITLFALLVLSVLQREIPLLREQVPILLAKLNAALSPRLAEMGVHVSFDFPALRKLLTEQIASSPEDVMDRLFSTLKISSSAAAALLGAVVVIPLLLFYLLLDWETLIARFQRLIPRRWLPKAMALAQEADVLLSQYLRGQLLVMGMLALYYTIALWLAGFDIALPIGTFTGLAVFIPYIGYGVGLALAILAALLQFGNLYGFLAVAAIYGFGQVIESFFLTPRLVGERIGMHPLAVIFALLAFGQLFGFFGILLALPACAILMVGLRQIHLLYLRSRFYQN